MYLHLRKNKSFTQKNENHLLNFEVQKVWQSYVVKNILAEELIKTGSENSNICSALFHYVKISQENA